MQRNPPRILIVEDEGLVAMILEDIIRDFGYEVVGPAQNCRKAIGLLAEEVVDAALLDVNLGDERVDPVAEALQAAAIPFTFTTGYVGASALPPGFQDRPVVYKPYRFASLKVALDSMLPLNADAKA